VALASDAVEAQLEVPDSPGHASDHVLVKLEETDPPRALAGVEESGVDGWLSLPVPEGKTPADFVAELNARPDVEVAELDPIVQLDPPVLSAGHFGSVTVNDPDFQLQWHLPAVQADQAWGASTGTGAVVAVVDTGISKGGEDLACHEFVSPYNAITDSSGAAAANDDHGHGTHVAGTVAQCTNNGVGVAGVAFGSRLMPVKVLNSGGAGVISDIAEGIEWARTHGADVINLSLGCHCEASIVDEAIEAAVADGVILVAASGNDDGNSVFYPARHPDVIAVGATDFRNVRAPYSNRGSHLELVAPGGDLDRDDNDDGNPDGVLQETFQNNVWDYYYIEGTSMATAHVSGAVALLLGAYPEVSPVVLRTALTTTALDLGSSGFDTSYGHGLIQVHDALLTDLERPVWTEGTLLVESYGETSLTFTWSAPTDNEAVTGYLLRRDGSEGLVVNDRTATVTGLSPGTRYVFEVLARDEAGNWSEPLSAAVRTAQAFTDTAGHTFYGDILWMSGSGVTRGCNPPAGDLFCPDDLVTRGQLAAFLVRALGLTESDHPGFVDVAKGSTFESEIGKLATGGITRGCNPPVNDRFCPDDPVPRAHAAAFLVRALGLTKNTHPGFVDVVDGSAFESDIGKLATAGITQGCNPPANDRFCPEGALTRGQLAALLHRALGTSIRD
jgi:serine protease